MTLILLASGLLALHQADEPQTAAQLYEGCERYLAGTRSPNRVDVEAESCAITMSAQSLLAEAELVAQEMDPNQPDARKICLPENLSEEGDAGRPLAQAFVD